MGIMRGAGRHTFPAISSIICYYFIGAPLGFYLMMYTYLEMDGYWIGINLAFFLQCISCITYTSCFNWEKIIKIRGGGIKLPTSVTTEKESNIDENFHQEYFPSKQKEKNEEGRKKEIIPINMDCFRG